MFAESAIGTFVSTASAFFMEQLGMSVAFVGVLLVTILVVGIGGAHGARYLMDVRSVPVDSMMRRALIFFALIVTAQPFILYKPEHTSLVFPVGALYGIAFGAWYASTRACFFGMVPCGKEMEYTGLYMFAGTVIGWLPVLLMLLLNVQTGSMRWTPVVSVGFMLVGLCVFFQIDIVASHSAVAASSSSDEERCRDQFQPRSVMFLESSSERSTTSFLGVPTPRPSSTKSLTVQTPSNEGEAGVAPFNLAADTTT
jgi:MFS-type transporter involved in bile tolerance (Atg22 family)